MELDSSLEPTPHWYWIEMGRVGRKIVEEYFPIEPGEHVVVTADTTSDWRAVEEVVKAIYAVGAIPTLITYPTTGAATADPPPVSAALAKVDAWIEMNNNDYLLYSNAWKQAMIAGVRYFTLGGEVGQPGAHDRPGDLPHPRRPGEQVGRAFQQSIRDAYHLPQWNRYPHQG